MIRLPVRFFVVALIGFVLTGCGDGVSRSVVKVSVSSSKVKFDDTDSISVAFTPEGTGDIASASGNPNKQPFTVGTSSKEVQGIAPGKYKVTVAITPYAGMSQPAHDQAVRELSARYSTENSKLTHEVVAGKEQSITIDLDAGTLTAN